MRLKRFWPIAVVIVIIAAFVVVLLPGEIWLRVMGGLAALILLLGGWWLMLRILYPAPVPSSAVRELLRLLEESRRPTSEEWTLVRFRPRVSLGQVSERVGAVTEQMRETGFLVKVRELSPLFPQVVIFYSADRGLICGRVLILKQVLRQYGWLRISTWYTLVGVLRGEGREVYSLDGPQTVLTHRMQAAT